MRPLIRMHPHHLAQRNRTAFGWRTDLQFEGDARISDPPDPNVHVEFLIEPYRQLVLDHDLHDVKIGAASNLARIVVPEAAQEFRQGNIEVGHLVRVVDEALLVDFGIARSQPQEISRCFARHHASSAGQLAAGPQP